MSGSVRSASRRYARLLTEATGLPWYASGPEASAGASTHGVGWPDYRPWVFSAHASGPGYRGGEVDFDRRCGAGDRVRRLQLGVDLGEGARANEYARRDWPEVCAPVVAPVALEEHNLWASAVADALESCRGATIALLVGEVPDRRRLPRVSGDMRERDRDPEERWAELEGATLPPGYALQPSPAGFAWRWAGERSGHEPWSWPQAVEGARREAWEDFWCRRPSLGA